MTTRRLRRCSHCGTPYCYQASGEGCDRLENSGSHCPTCAQALAKAILEAFKDIPKKFQMVWVETSEVSVETLMGWEAKAQEERPPSGGDYNLNPVRVHMNLYDQEDIENINRVGVVAGRDSFKGRIFRYSYWTKRAQDEVWEKMEQNLETGEMRPWERLPPIY